ncbi:MAG TPA: tetratricopeptide repeat protein [Planctomycetota bacterium]|nr:tetratricopeptide repeat protein [Planctomycetota bacterium]
MNRSIAIGALWLVVFAGMAATEIRAATQGIPSTQAEANPDGRLQGLARDAALRREAQALDARLLPKAEAGRWNEWLPTEWPAPAHAVPYGEAVLAYQASDLWRAVGLSRELLLQEPDYPPALLLMAASFFRVQRYSDAIECYERLLRQSPSSVGRTRQLGHCYHSLGRSREALEHYARVLEAAPEDWQAHRARGIVWLRTGNLEAARIELEPLLQTHPEDPDVLYGWASLLYEADGTKGLREAAQAACDAAPYQSRTWYLLAQVALDLDLPELAQSARARYEELLASENAIRHLQQAWWADPSNLERLEQIARLTLASGDTSAAERIYGQLMQAARRADDTPRFERSQRALAGLRQVR